MKRQLNFGKNLKMLKEELNYDQNHYLNISFSTEISAPY
jgi:hypothetical protein